MLPSTLYIIGNGFDLWHGIPSSCKQFKEYVSSCDERMFDAVDRYLHADEDWSDLESALAGIDVDAIIDDLSGFMVSYGADAQVLHIHGKATLPNSELILGHAWNPVQRQSLNDGCDEDTDSRLMEAHNILDDYFAKTFKPSEQLITEHQAFFDQLGAIDIVHVLGHSLSEVDLLYFQALLRMPRVAAAQWHIACRSEQERPMKHARLVEIGVPAKLIKPVLWEDL
jgi:Bacteriophage abortive infection AbiH